MSRIVRRLGATLVLATVSLFIGSNVYAEVEITHDPPEELLAGARTTLQAEITDDEAGIDQVRAYFRAGGSSDYVYADMTSAGDDDNYAGTLPALAQDAGTLDYFLLVRSNDGNVVKSQNFTVEVAAAAVPSTAPRQVILQPSGFADVQGYHGKLVKLVGDVQVVGTDGTARSAADAGYVVRERETLRTGNDGRAVVDFDGDPITVLEEASRLNVRTPSWLTHLAGKAYFAFKKLLNVSQDRYAVSNTVALIGIRGTKLYSYAILGVGLSEGTIGVGAPGGDVLQITRDGVTQSSQTFTLETGRFARFSGNAVTDRPLTAAELADIARAEQFVGPIGGDTVRVTAESQQLPLAVPGVNDNLLLVQAEPAAALGIAAAAATVVASAGGVSTTASVVLGALGVGVLAGASDSGGSSSSSSSDDISDDTTPPPDDPSPPTGGSDFVGITVNYQMIDGEFVCLEATDPCGGVTTELNPTMECGGFSSSYASSRLGSGGQNLTENISWPNGAPAGNYSFDVVYCGQQVQSLIYIGDILVSPNPSSQFNGTLLRLDQRETRTFTVP